MRRIARCKSRAYILISVLICLTVVMALGTAWLRMIGLERAHLRADQRGVQAELLAASGLSRAVARLAGDGNYVGETWRLDGTALENMSGTVTITVDSVPERPAERRINVVAEHPAEGTMRVRRSREAVYPTTLPNSREDVSP
jgi:hypothetical protein